MRSKDGRRLRRLIPYVARDGRRLGLTLLLLIPVALMAAVQPLLVGQVIAVLHDESTLSWLTGLPVGHALRLLVSSLCFAILIRFSLLGVQVFNIQAVGQRLTARIREDLFSHAIALSLYFHDRIPVGKLLTRLTNDVDALSEVFSSGIIGILADLVTLLIIIVTMISIETRLGCILLITQIPITFTVMWLQRKYRKANYKVREDLSQLNADFQENLQGMEVVQMFCREGFNSVRFARIGRSYRQAVDGTIFLDSAIAALIEWVALIAVATVLTVGGWMVTTEVIGLGTLTTFILYSQRLFDPLRQLAERFTQIQGGLTAVERIGELLEQPIEIMDSPKEQSKFIYKQKLDEEYVNPSEVVFEDVSFSYREDEPILQQLSFRVPSGKHAAIVGPTGSGKSTIIRLLCRLYEPQKGRILLDGIDIRELPLSVLRHRLGVVLQDPFIFSGDVATNLRLNAQLTKSQILSACKQLGVSPFLDRLSKGLDTELRERGGNLSSGERQLLSIARVAIRNPSVLVMDEATASMDPSTEASLQKDLESLLNQRTAIVIAHRLATIEAADQILVLKRGKLIESGTHAELRNQGGIYSKLIRLQERGFINI
uniref:ATPase n=1 Tax=Paulinella chromatophora TaxID=39717 RepID=B1X5W1_PAUCH|nr:ATPase [Paulinella chromatophora]ACB43330.1 ATPase [Paulinella chromatophora]|eukprot:gb/GEZN01002092.1/.p1 GENE.gb/GEZN01002092.1/~~gb/GEZN01002092.1/.p1  ORF type:complete len:601 (-),score=-41.36 gb/GEZN01002092.1/:2-1804(-)